jgi:fumarate hydratase, class II
MQSVQVMASDVAVGLGGASGYLEMNVYKPLIIANIAQSITLITDDGTNFRTFLVEGSEPNRKKIKEYVDHSLMLVTALAPVIGYDEASQIAHHAMDHDLILKEAVIWLCRRSGVRPGGRSGKDGPTFCRDQLLTESFCGGCARRS